MFTAKKMFQLNLFLHNDGKRHLTIKKKKWQKRLAQNAAGCANE